MKIVKESFVERGYMLDENSNPVLIPRGMPNDEIETVSEAVEQYSQLKNGYINIGGQKKEFDSETVCIHSDSKIALALAQVLDDYRG